MRLRRVKRYVSVSLAICMLLSQTVSMYASDRISTNMIGTDMLQSAAGEVPGEVTEVQKPAVITSEYKAGAAENDKFTLYNYDYAAKTQWDITTQPLFGGLTTCNFIVGYTGDKMVPEDNEQSSEGSTVGDTTSSTAGDTTNSTVGDTTSSTAGDTTGSTASDITYVWRVAENSKDIIAVDSAGSYKEIGRVTAICVGEGIVEVDAIYDGKVIWTGSCQVEVVGTDLSTQIFNELYVEGTNLTLPTANDIAADFDTKSQAHPRIQTTMEEIIWTEKYITMGKILNTYSETDIAAKNFNTKYEKIIYEEFQELYPDGAFPRTYIDYMYSVYNNTYTQNIRWLRWELEYKYEIKDGSLLYLLKNMQQEVEQLGLWLLLYHAKEEIISNNRSYYVSEEEYNSELASFDDAKVTKTAVINRLQTILDTICEYQSWNPDNFLDVGELSYVAGVAYDWLYNDLTLVERAYYASKIMELSVKEGNRYFKTINSQGRFRSNWSAVDFSGVSVASMAIMGEKLSLDESDTVTEQNKLLCANQIASAVRFLPIFIKQMDPGGVEAEGTGYWNLAMRFLVYLYSSLDTTLGKDYGMMSVKGLEEALFFPIYVTGNSNVDKKETNTYNYGDANGGEMAQNVLVWMMDKFSQIAEAKGESYKEKAQALMWYKMNYSRVVDSEYWTATSQDLLWMPKVVNRYGNSLDIDMTDEKLAAIGIEKVAFLGSDVQITNDEYAAHDLMSDSVVYGRESNNSIVTVRQSFINQSGVFFAAKDYNAMGTHLDMDAGGFIYDALGTRWFEELGKTTYAGDRYSYYVKRAEGHNTLVINPREGAELNMNASAVTNTGTARFEEEKLYKGDGSTALVYNMSNAYNEAYDANGVAIHNSNYVGRGFMLFDNNEKLLIQDEIELEEASDIYSFLQTSVDATDITVFEDGKTIILKKFVDAYDAEGNKTQVERKLMLKLNAVCNNEYADIRFKVMPYQSLIDAYNTENSTVNQEFYMEYANKRKIGIHISENAAGETTLVSKATIQILVIPFVDTVSDTELCQTTYEDAYACEMPELIDIAYWDEHPLISKTAFDYDYHPTKIQLEKLDLSIGGRIPYTVDASYADGKAPVSTLVWTSSNEKIATVDENGVITPGPANGECTINICYKKNPRIKMSLSVSVMIPRSISLSLTGTTFSTTTGRLLKYKVSPSICPNMEVTVTSKNPDIVKAEFTEEGIWLTPVGNGTCKVVVRSVADPDVYKTCTVTVRLPQDLELTNVPTNMMAGETCQLGAKVLPENAINQELRFSSSDKNVLTVDQNGLITAVAKGTADVTVRCRANSAVRKTFTVVVDQIFYPTVIKLNYTDVEFFATSAKTLKWIVYPTNADDKSVTVKSSDSSVVTVTKDGVMTPVKNGTCTIEVRSVSDPNIYSVCNVTVCMPTDVTINNLPQTLNVGQKIQLTSTILPAETKGNVAKYYTSNKAVVAVDSAGNLTAIGKGTCEITVKCKSNMAVSKTYTVNVIQPPTKVKVTTPELLFSGTAAKQVKCIVYPTTAEDRSVTFGSTNKKVATVTADGMVTPVANGTCKIVVRSKMVPSIYGVCEVTVCMPTDVNIANMPTKMNVGETVQLIGTVLPAETLGTGIKYYTSNKAVVTVDTNGLLTAVGKGTCEITVKCKNNLAVSKTYTITVGQMPTKVKVTTPDLLFSGTASKQVKWIVYPTTTDEKSVTFGSTNKEVATVTADGTVTPVANGTCKIIVRSNAKPSIYGVCNVTVCMPTDVNVTNMPTNMKVGETLQLTGEMLPAETLGTGLKYYTSNKEILLVDANGVLTAVGKGTCEITVKAKTNLNVSKTYTVTVGQPVTKIKLSVTSMTFSATAAKQLKYIVYPTDADDKRVSFYSTNKSVATVTQDGMITPVGNGTCRVRVKSVAFPDIYSYCTVTVCLPTQVYANNMPERMAVGETVSLDSVILPTEALGQDVKYSSSDRSVAIVDDTGLVTAIGKGTCEITLKAKSNPDVIKVYTLNVYYKPTKIKLNVESLNLTSSVARQLKWTVYPVEAEDKEVSITSSDTNVVVVSADGNVKPVGNGTCTVRVQCVDYPDVYTEIPVTVNAPIFENTLVQSVGKTVANPNLAKSMNQLVNVGVTTIYQTIR